MAFGIDSSYDWDLAVKLVKGQKMMNDYLDKVLAKTANDSNARIAFRKLRGRIYLATQQLQNLLLKFSDLQNNSSSVSTGVSSNDTVDKFKKKLN